MDMISYKMAMRIILTPCLKEKTLTGLLSAGGEGFEPP